MNSDIREWEYRYYVADSLRFIPENKHYSKSLREILNPAPVDNRSVEEITEDICRRAGIKKID